MIEIIPAIDIIDGRCVRLEQGDFARKTVYADDPVATALRFRDAGLARLHIVDLDGARDGRPKNLDVLRRVADEFGLKIDFGGGVRTDVDVEDAFDAGAAMVNVTSVAVRDPDRFRSWIDRFGPEKFMLGADSRSGLVAADGWTADTGIRVVDLVREYAPLAVLDVFVTDIACDGMLNGPNLDLYRMLKDEFPQIRLVASGGVGSMKDIEALDAAGCSGVIVGKAIYEDQIGMEEIRSYVGKTDNSLSRR